MHNSCCTLTLMKYFACRLLIRRLSAMGSSRVAKSLPLQVAAVCYRRRGTAIEFLLVNTNGGNKWTFPKGSTDPHLSQQPARGGEGPQEAGAIGTIEPRHFHLYLHSKG